MIQSPTCSIHPQGWVPIETVSGYEVRDIAERSSIHPQGWVPIETGIILCSVSWVIGSIHPQGWVPIETIDCKEKGFERS